MGTTTGKGGSACRGAMPAGECAEAGQGRERSSRAGGREWDEGQEKDGEPCLARLRLTLASRRSLSLSFVRPPRRPPRLPKRPPHRAAHAQCTCHQRSVAVSLPYLGQLPLT